MNLEKPPFKSGICLSRTLWNPDSEFADRPQESIPVETPNFQALTSRRWWLKELTTYRLRAQVWAALGPVLPFALLGCLMFASLLFSERSKPRISKLLLGEHEPGRIKPGRINYMTIIIRLLTNILTYSLLFSERARRLLLPRGSPSRATAAEAPREGNIYIYIYIYI